MSPLHAAQDTLHNGSHNVQGDLFIPPQRTEKKRRIPQFCSNLQPLWAQEGMAGGAGGLGEVKLQNCQGLSCPF